MYCNQCGAKVPDTAKFCQSCGSAVGTGYPTQPAPTPENGGKKPGKKPLLVIIAVLVLILLFPLAKQLFFTGPAETPIDSEDTLPIEIETPELPEAVEAEPEQICAPDPDTYFCTNDCMGSNKFYGASFSEDPSDAINHYMRILCDNYGMALVYSHDGDGYQERILQKGDNENAFVSLELDASDDGTYFLWLKYGEPVNLLQAEVCDAPPAEVVYTSEPSPTPSVSTSTQSSDTSTSDSDREFFTPEFAKQDCLICRGDGDCNTCGGSGEVRKYAGGGETVRAKCSSCYGSGNCRSCGGSGKR